MMSLLFLIFILTIIATAATYFIKRYHRAFGIISFFILFLIFAVYSILTFSSYHSGIMDASQFPLAVNKYIDIDFSIGLTGLTASLSAVAYIITIFALLISNMEDSISTGLIATAGLGLIGLFISRDFLFFFIFWEIAILAVFFIIYRYGRLQRRSISIKFFIYMHVGSLFLLLGFFALATYYYIDFHIISFSFQQLLNYTFFSTIPVFGAGFIIFSLLLVFLIKLPIFPLHGWLADSYNSAPYSGTVMLAGGLGMMGGYGLFGIMYPLLINVLSHDVSYILIGLGILSLIYFSTASVFQESIKMMLAYLSAADLSFVLISFGVSLISHGKVSVLAASGGMYQIIAASFLITMAFASLFIIYKKTGTEMIYRLGGITRNAPFLAGFTLMAFVGILGLPGFTPFISEFSIIISSFQSIGAFSIIIVIGLMIIAASLIWAAQRALFGPYNENLGSIKDLNKPEFLILLGLFALAVLSGIYPDIFFKIISIYAGGVI
ncbi:NADH-quinone oxidoreductase subunit M [Picrophilus oshimae]|uniref:NADH dehydrogenase subunit M n=1 Tax=Picrophilus torridus (strain ATCC 700027 / DSM 9790 / JCM 10055 / NBRC 100828 / KAW 2/3) TaxID=1122961 RepID=A0A8G2L7P7_PICTO|nr:NADH-quinone oxidoreductase subunit M [Picrophilus oshimae]SMD31240.1 NADH dehydrogenase subunit M [Picrophilus oshimae DSM 9789]